jgi:hypothetical protein
MPVYGGGDVLYCETAYLTGLVVRRAGAYELADLRFCKIVRDDLEVIIPLEP